MQFQVQRVGDAVDGIVRGVDAGDVRDGDQARRGDPQEAAFPGPQQSRSAFASLSVASEITPAMSRPI